VPNSIGNRANSEIRGGCDAALGLNVGFVCNVEDPDMLRYIHGNFPNTPSVMRDNENTVTSVVSHIESYRFDREWMSPQTLRVEKGKRALKILKVYPIPFAMSQRISDEHAFAIGERSGVIVLLSRAMYLYKFIDSDVLNVNFSSSDDLGGYVISSGDMRNVIVSCVNDDEVCGAYADVKYKNGTSQRYKFIVLNGEFYEKRKSRYWNDAVATLLGKDDNYETSRYAMFENYLKLMTDLPVLENLTADMNLWKISLYAANLAKTKSAAHELECSKNIKYSSCFDGDELKVTCDKELIDAGGLAKEFAYVVYESNGRFHINELLTENGRSYTDVCRFPLLSTVKALVHSHPSQINQNGFSNKYTNATFNMDGGGDYGTFGSLYQYFGAGTLSGMYAYLAPPRLTKHPLSTGNILAINISDVIEFSEYWDKNNGSSLCNERIIPDAEKQLIYPFIVDQPSGLFARKSKVEMETKDYEFYPCLQK